MSSGTAIFYNSRLSAYSDQLVKVRRQSAWVGWSRLIIFLIGVSVVVFIVREEQILLGVGLLLLLILVFAAVVYYHVKLEGKVRRLKAFVDLNREELARKGGNWQPVDGGEQYLPEDHSYAHDLDVFGPFSLFQLINRSFLHTSKETLAHQLLHPASIAEIKDRQLTFKALSQKPEWCQEWIVTSRLSAQDSEKTKELYGWLDRPSIPIPMWLNISSIALPILMLVGLILVAVGILHYTIIIYLFLINLFLVGYIGKALGKDYAAVHDKSIILKEWVALFELIEQSEWTDPNMSKIYQTHCRELNTNKGLKTLLQYINLLDARNNMLVSGGLNGLLLYDIHVFRGLNRWKKRNTSLSKMSLGAIAEVDTIVAFATYTFNHPTHVFSEVLKDFKLEGKGLIHPLLPAEKAIPNDIQIERFGDMQIITGSNMSGKSTWLRTVGINLVLANIGAPIAAKSFRFYPIDIACSMRISDDLAKGESTFYVELKRLKSILTKLQNGRQLFVLLDEILRGTNSKDKLTGSKAFVRQLIQSQSAGLIATHDLELGELASEYPENITNLSFEVDIRDQQFIFDYKIKQGICKTLNATELMQKMGIKV